MQQKSLEKVGRDRAGKVLLGWGHAELGAEPMEARASGVRLRVDGIRGIAPRFQIVSIA